MPTPTEQGKARGDELRQEAARLESKLAMLQERAAEGSTRAKEEIPVVKDNLTRIRTALKGKGGTGYKKGGMVKKSKGGYANCGASMKPTQKFSCGGMAKAKRK
jgi:hypothetical protein